jgi:hypothetical protein
MKCKDFRKLIISDNPDLDALQKHMESCEKCKVWVEKELSTPPEGLTSSQWLEATSRCMPELNENPGEIKEEIKTPVQGFLSGMKYGIVFGLSLIVGLSIIQLHIEQNPPTLIEKTEIESFMDTNNKQIPMFFNTEISRVTFFEATDSKELSFIENDDESQNLTSFIEENQEEFSWIEEDSG